MNRLVFLAALALICTIPLKSFATIGSESPLVAPERPAGEKKPWKTTDNDNDFSPTWQRASLCPSRFMMNPRNDLAKLYVLGREYCFKRDQYVRGANMEIFELDETVNNWLRNNTYREIDEAGPLVFAAGLQDRIGLFAITTNWDKFFLDFMTEYRNKLRAGVDYDCVPQR